MHIIQYIIEINVENGPKFQSPRMSAYSPYLKKYLTIAMHEMLKMLRKWGLG